MGTGQLLYSRGLRVVAVFASAFALAAFAVWVLSAVPASADKSAPAYTLSIVEGASTQPEDPILSVSGSDSSEAQVAVSITRNGLIVDKQSGEGGVWLSQVPQVGDIVTLESPIGVVRGSVVYDGLPSIDPTVCAGSTNFSGKRSEGETIKGAYYTVVPHPSYFAHRHGGLAQVQVLSGPTFQGSFLTPLAIGESVEATESLTSTIESGATFTYTSENDRPVGACPVPPPPPPPPPPLALTGSLVKFARTSIHRLLHFGWSIHVTVNQPGRIVEDLYLHHGVVPAFAATSKGKHVHRLPPAVLLAHGTTTAKTAGTFKVTMHVTAKGRRLLDRAHSVKVVVVTTLTAGSGAKLTLERHSLTLHR